MTTTTLDGFMKAMRTFVSKNRPPAIEEPDNPFEELVNQWAEQKDALQAIKDAMDTITVSERQLRDRLAEGLRQYYGINLKEGVNNYELSNGRKLKFTHKVERKISEPDLAAAKDAFTKAAVPGDKTFEELLRVKYELDKRNYDKLSEPAANAFSRCLTTKHAAPALEVD